MLFSVSIEGEVIYARDVELKGIASTKFYCPNCSQQVFYKKSHRGTPFFSHLIKCHGNKTRLKSLESKEHILGKEIILSELQRMDNLFIQAEFYFPEINQYADVFVKTSSQSPHSTIYEFQRSIISSHEIYLRNYNYQQEVDKIHWLIDFYATERINIYQKWKQTMLNYCVDYGFHLKLLDLKNKEIVIHHNLPIIFKKEFYEFNQSRLPLQEFQQNNSLKTANNKIVSVSNQEYKEVHYHRQVNSIMNNGTYRQSIYLLYQQGSILTELPKWIFTEHWQILLTKSPSWLVFSWVLTMLKQMKSSFKTVDFIEKIKSCTEIQLVDIPLIREDVYPIVSMSILILLFRKGIVEKASENIWIVKN